MDALDCTYLLLELAALGFVSYDTTFWRVS